MWCTMICNHTVRNWQRHAHIKFIKHHIYDGVLIGPRFEYKLPAKKIVDTNIQQ